MVYRNATNADLESIHKSFGAILETLDYYNQLARENERKKYSIVELERKIEEDPKSVILAIKNDIILGFCFNYFDDYLIWLEWIIVLPEYHGLSIGHGLLKYLIKTALERGCHKIWCDSRTSNDKSNKFLLKSGFQKIAEIENHWYGQNFYLWQLPISK